MSGVFPSPGLLQQFRKDRNLETPFFLGFWVEDLSAVVADRESFSAALLLTLPDL